MASPMLMAGGHALERVQFSKQPRSLALSLASRGHVDCSDRGHTGASGAQSIILTVTSRRFVTRLLLGHNRLGDEGCEVLFDFLCTDEGQMYKVEEISLNSNEIGDRGLRAIARYLHGNTSLRDLFLQNNLFSGDSEAVSAFALAVSNSHVQTLALSTNRTLGDAFIAQFMPLLSCPHLEVLHFSAIGLTALSAPYLVDYLLAPRSRPLSCLTLNGNQLTYPAIQAIIAAVQQGNFHLTKLEMFSNCFVRPDGGSSEDSEESTSMSSWRQSQDHLKDLLWRNDYLARAVQSEALGMLCYCRLLLLRPQKHRNHLSGSEGDSSSSASAELPRTDAFARLPLELQHHILAFLAPTLSAAQLIRIFHHAADPATLPEHTLRLPTLSRSPPPGPKPDAPFSGMRLRHGALVDHTESSRAGSLGLTVARCAMRNEERARWLRAVGCEAYERDPASPFACDLSRL